MMTPYQKYIFGFFYNVGMVGVGVTCAVLSMRDLLRIQREQEQIRKLKKSWETVCDGHRETNTHSR